MDKEFIEQEIEVLEGDLAPNLKIDHINNLDLRSDLENENIVGCVLKTQGYIGNRPNNYVGEHEDDTWAIDCFTIEGDVVTSYLYVSELEYKQDIKTLING